MAYTSKNGRRPMEMASKTNHSAIIRHPLVQEFLKECRIPEAADADAVELQAQPVAPPSENGIRIIIAIDGGYREVEVKKEYPSSSYTFFQFGGLLLETDDLQALHGQPFIDPEDMAKLRNMQRFPFVLPTKNIRYNNCNTLVDSVRWSVFNFFTKSVDGEKPFIQALRWFLFQEYDASITSRSWTLAHCPHCQARSVPITPAMGNVFPCPECTNTIYLTDVFRLHEVVDNELGAGEILGYLQAVLEQMLLVHLIKTVWELKKSMLSQILFVKDGPLAFFGQTANMHDRMRRLLNFLSNQPHPSGSGTTNYVNLAGVEKSGSFVEHAEVIRGSIPLGHALILDNDYIYRYITPGAGDENEAFGSTSYYGSKVIFKAEDGNIYVLTVPTPRPLLHPTAQDFSNFNLVLHTIAKLRCHMYDNALVPVALINKLVSLSDHPSSKILSAFAKSKTSYT
ncbi:MAG: DNA double-strand break repair nuclease NurA [Kouleothrix sp.]|nr:DNA double-strand break repair nuclease NurA [Kouleothrix sp.]